MAKKIYAGTLSFSTTEDSLSDTFGQFGEVVSAVIVTDRYTGRSRGFGFVEMSSDDEANAAIEALNGKDVDGRQLTVNRAKERSR